MGAWSHGGVLTPMGKLWELWGRVTLLPVLLLGRGDCHSPVLAEWWDGGAEPQRRARWVVTPRPCSGCPGR